jgi:hypothetical protein
LQRDKEDARGTDFEWGVRIHASGESEKFSTGLVFADLMPCSFTDVLRVLHVEGDQENREVDKRGRMTRDEGEGRLEDGSASSRP